MDVSTGEGTQKSGEGGGAEAAMQVGDKSSVRKELRVKRADCGDWAGQLFNWSISGQLVN